MYKHVYILGLECRRYRETSTLLHAEEREGTRPEHLLCQTKDKGQRRI